MLLVHHEIMIIKKFGNNSSKQIGKAKKIDRFINDMFILRASLHHTQTKKTKLTSTPNSFTEESAAIAGFYTILH